MELIDAGHLVGRESVLRELIVLLPGYNMGLDRLRPGVEINGGDALDVRDGCELDKVLVTCNVDRSSNKYVFGVVFLAQLPVGTTFVQAMI